MRARLVAITLGSLLLLPSAAFASGQDVIRDCTDDEQLSRTYSPADYRDALASLPADADQYSDCRAAIIAAQRGKGLGGPGSGSGQNTTGGSWGGAPIPGVPAGVDPLSTASPVEQAAIASAAKTGAAPLTIDGTPIYPSELGTSGLNDPTDLPTPLLAAMVLLALGTLAAATRWSLTHVRKRRTTS